MAAETQPESPIEIPQHIGIILDGNRRWARAQNFPTLKGHQQGMDNTKTIIDHAIKRGVKMLTVFAFSTENWKRTQDEVGYLMRLFEDYARKQRSELHERGVQVRIMGQIDRLTKPLQRALADIVDETKENSKLIFSMCLSYGGRDELIRAFKKMVSEGLGAAEITEQAISDHLDSAGLPDPDLIIRTSGEQRLSNFLTWQSVYSELYFTPIPWPAFDGAALDAAIDWYQLRDRRFGK